MAVSTAVLVLAVLILPAIYSRFSMKPGYEFAYKGATSVSYIYSREGVAREGGLFDTLRAGDLVQIRYSSVSKGHLALMSIDISGKVSFYDPDPSLPDCSIPISPGAGHYFPSSIRLDSTPGPELVIALFSPNPVGRDSLKQWITNSFNSAGNDLSRLGEKLRANRFDNTGSVIATIRLNKSR
jgi:hypothetical protein